NIQYAELIDIRPRKDFEEGYIKVSRNIPFTELKIHFDALRSADHPIIIVCQMGMTAGTAVAMIGKDNVYRLDGGIT
ncbi:rhodanese-like domain-containing protein, partial [Mycobacterium tuberculosis]|nr:rhodanese-like domain-containing protein [Mycobacterium tuberculosis]